VKADAPTGTARHRGVGLALIGMAAFLLVLAPMLRWYAYPRLAVVPADVDGTLVSVGDATVFDIDDRAERRTDLTSIRTVRSDVSTGAGEVAVWDTFVKTMDAEGTTVSAQTERAAFDPHTGVALPGFGENVDGDPVEHVGQVFKFPFGTREEDLRVLRPDLAQARSALYEGEDEIHGVMVYRFVQSIEPVAHATVEVPGSIVGSGPATVEADRVYANVRTLWVEPETGVIIKGEERQKSSLRFRDGATVTLTEAAIGYDDRTVSENATEYGDLADRLRLVRDTAPLAAITLGLSVLACGLVAGGLALGGRAGARSAADSAAGSEPHRADLGVVAD
jgi:hypothetical protein